MAAHHRQPIAFACNSSSGKESAVRTGPVTAKAAVMSWSHTPPCAIGASITSLVKKMRLLAGRLRYSPLSHLRQASLSEAVCKVVSYRCVAQRLGAEPMADRKMRVGDQEQFCFSPRLLKVAQLRKRSSQEFA